jgi:inosine-uridine nucleoside N-ribohydrolase
MKITPIVVSLLMLACTASKTDKSSEKIRVVFDSDTNNELDDQHALAYLLFNGNSFGIAGVTVNATRSGGRIELQYAEAERVIRLCGFGEEMPLSKGANSSFDSISQRTDSASFDGAAAVNFIIDEAEKPAKQKLAVIAVGKLTNLALALKKEPSIANSIRLVWLGSNYPDPGEYNQDNDTASVNYVLGTNVEFEIVTVRYGKPNGSDVVRLTQAEVNQNMPGKGPHIAAPVTGRHGGNFTTFGDYSVNLFEHINYHGTPPSRALFDMVAVAIVKNPDWGKKTVIPAPKLINNRWVEQPENPRKIVVWGDFDKEKIIADFYQTMDHYQKAEIVK